MSKLTLKTEGDRYVVITRRFAASPEAVFRAHTEPKLIQKWMLGPEGWSMPVCINDPRPGGKFHYEWTNDAGRSFHISGEFVETSTSAIRRPSVDSQQEHGHHNNTTTTSPIATRCCAMAAGKGN